MLSATDWHVDVNRGIFVDADYYGTACQGSRIHERQHDGKVSLVELLSESVVLK